MIDRLLAEHKRHSPRLPRDPRGAWAPAGRTACRHTPPAWGGAVPTARQPRRRSPSFPEVPPLNAIGRLRWLLGRLSDRCLGQKRAALPGLSRGSGLLGRESRGGGRGGAAKQRRRSRTNVTVMVRTLLARNITDATVSTPPGIPSADPRRRPTAHYSTRSRGIT